MDKHVFLDAMDNQLAVGDWCLRGLKGNVEFRRVVDTSKSRIICDQFRVNSYRVVNSVSYRGPSYLNYNKDLIKLDGYQAIPAKIRAEIEEVAKEKGIELELGT